MAFIDNIKEITPAVTELKSNTPVIVIDGKIYVAGIGGNFIPGNAAASLSGTANIAAGYITISDSVITVHNVTDGTTSTTDKLYIADTGVDEPEYLRDAPAPAGLDFYKCASVNTSDSTWTGYKAIIDSDTGFYHYLNTATQDLKYTSVIPKIDSTYSRNGLVQATLYNGVPYDGLIFYASLNGNTPNKALTGQTLSGTVTYQLNLGIPCGYFDGSTYISFSDEGLASLEGNTSKTISLMLKCTKPLTGSWIQKWALAIGTWSTGKCIGIGNTSSSNYNNVVYATCFGGDTHSGLNIAMSWHHIVYVVDVSYGYGKLYIDGMLLNISTSTIPQLDLSTANNKYIGRGLGSGQEFTGYISSIRIYNRALYLRLIKALASLFTPINS